MASGKWIATAASIWIQSSAGASYAFGIYSSLLKSTQSYDQSTLDTVSFFKDIGANAGVMSGFLFSAVSSSSTFRSGGPWVVHLAGAIQCFVGYFFLWAAVTGTISRPSVPLMCFFMFLAAHAQTFFNTANVVTGVYNFPEYSGTIVGIMKVMLFGASDSYSGDSVMQVTLAFNHFGQGLVQRMPRCRWGFFHVVNNDYTHWQMYAIGGSQHPTIISEGNRFVAPHSKDSKEVTKRDYAAESVWKEWTWTSTNDLMMNGAFFVESGRRRGRSSYGNKDVIKAKPGRFVSRLTRFAGALNCKLGKKC